MRSLSGEMWYLARGGTAPHWIERRAVILNSRDSWAIPLRPTWFGFSVNSLFYAALLWLLIPGPFVLRRFVRVNRRLCPACAYPMGEAAVCTECGRPLRERAVA